MAVTVKAVRRLSDELSPLHERLMAFAEEKEEVFYNAEERNASEETLGQLQEQLDILENARDSLEEVLDDLQNYE